MKKDNWPKDIQAAVSLTYDDALPVHIDHVTRKHEKNESRATFYTNIRDTFMQRHDDWKKVASRGHELGNHSIFHPCRKVDRMKWLSPCFDLKGYSPERFHRELEVANFILSLTDGKSVRSYGNNCCNTSIGSGDDETEMAPILRELFGAARGPLNEKIIVPEVGFNLFNLGHFNGDGSTFKKMKELIEETIEVGGWIIFMFHGVGQGTHNLYIDSHEHDLLLEWIGKKTKTLWSRPLIEVAEHIKSKS